MNRTRTRTTLVVHPSSGYTDLTSKTAVQHRLFRGNGQWHMGVGTTRYNTSYYVRNSPGVTGVVETMDDVVGAKGHFNYCSHQKVEYEAPVVPVECVGPLRTLDDKIAEGEARSVFTVGVSKDDLDYIPTFKQPTWPSDEDMLAQAASKANPTVVRPRFSLSQQAGELVEGFRSIKNGLDTANRIKRDLDRLDRWKSPKVRRLMGKRTLEQLTVRDWASLATNAHLGYTLAVRPLVNACKQLQDAAARYSSVVSGYMSTDDVYHGYSVRTSTTSYENHAEAPYQVQCRGLFKKEVYATVRVRYGPNRHLLFGGPLAPGTNASAAGNVFDKTYYGLNPSAATVWELTRLSFVVDWFLDIGGYLAQWDERPIPGLEYSILETGWSRKVSCRVEGAAQICQNEYAEFGLVQGPGIVTGTRTSEDYLREPKAFDPTIFTPTPPRFRLPSLEQAVTLAELVFSLAAGRKDLFRVAKPGSSKPA